MSFHIAKEGLLALSESDIHQIPIHWFAECFMEYAHVLDARCDSNPLICELIWDKVSVNL